MARPTITFDTLLNQQGALKGARDLRAKLANQPIEIKLNTKSLAQPLGRITGDVAEFTKSLQAATARVTAFGATSGAIFLISRGMSELAQSVITVDKQLTELNTFLGQSQNQLDKFGKSLFGIANDTASSFSDVAEAAKEFARQGLSVEETLKRTSDALILSRISGLGAAESVNALTTAINSFNKSGLTSTEIVNKIVKVDSNFAVSSNDLAQALTRVGSAAQDSGVGFEQLIAAVTAAQQTTGRGGAVIGNAFKTIFTRLKRPEVLADLEAIGVAVKDQNGFLLDGISILTNYAQATKNLSQVEKARTDELLGGVFQINQLKALTGDLSKANGIYARSVQQANNSTDEAIKKNRDLNKSLEALIARTTTKFQEKGGSAIEPLLRPTVKAGTDLANTILDAVGVDKTKISEEGAKNGEAFGQALLKGVGQAISGPGLAITLGIGLKIGQRLFSFLQGAATVLLDIKTNAANVQAIEQAINNTLAQQPKLTQAVLSGQISREQAAAQLLDLFKQQNQQLVLQKNLAAGLAQKFSTSGYTASPEFGIYQAKRGRRNSGYMPDVLVREKREAISKGAPANVVPYFAKATIGGRKQIVAANSAETIIPNYAGGTDTAIIPSYVPFEKIPRKASGYIPNFAGGNLGSGSFGTAVLLPSGKVEKIFPDGGGQRGAGKIANEVIAGKRLSEQIASSRELGRREMGQGFINPVFTAPQILSSLRDAVESGSVFKTYAPGRDAEKAASDLDKSTGEFDQFKKLTQSFARLAKRQIDAGEVVEARDLTKMANLVLNPKAENILRKIVSRRGGEKLGNILSAGSDRSFALLDRVAEAMSRQGAQISLIDPGIFGGVDKERKKALGSLGYQDNYPGFYSRYTAGGYVPNFASTFNAEKIKQMGGYVGQANKASASGLHSILNHIGIPIELDNITKKGLADTLSSKENKLKLYKFLKEQPIEVGNYPDSYSEVKDGNHRFTLAQFAGIKNIPAKYKDHFSGGYIPNLAGLSDAINRERMMSGLPDSKIMAHFDEMGNPIAVTNKRDEPNGLKDVARMSNGNMPSRKMVQLGSIDEMRNAIERNKQKFVSIAYMTEKGILENYKAEKDSFQFGPSVRTDEYVGANPPAGFSTWKEHREARNLVSLRTTDGQRKTLRLDRIKYINAEGNTYAPSAGLTSVMSATAPFSSAQLRRQGVENVGNLSRAMIGSEGSLINLKGAKTPAQFRKAVDNFISQVRSQGRKRSGGYVPNFARIPRISIPSRVPRIPLPGSNAPTAPQSPKDAGSFGSSAITSAVTQELLFTLPNILAGSIANERNEGVVKALLAGSAALSGAKGVVGGFKQGGLKGGLAGLVGAGVTGFTAFSQIGSIKENIQAQIFDKARDKAKDSFSKLTENVTQLSESISNLEAQYSDPNAKPDALIRLAKKQEEILGKISATNPELAGKVRAAATPEAKREALATAFDFQERQANVKTLTLNFAQLNKTERDAKTVSQFFSDLAIQLDTSKINIADLNAGNLNEALVSGGATGATGLFATQGKDFQNAFISFLNSRQAVGKAEAQSQLQLNRVRRPLTELQMGAERRDQIIKAEEGSRLSFLEQFGKFGENFGESASLSIQKDLDIYFKSRSANQVFSRSMATQVGTLSEGSFAKSYLSRFQDLGAGKELGSKISFAAARTTNESDRLILQNLLASNERTAANTQVIKDSAKIQEEYSRRLLDLQNRLSFAGGVKTSIDAASKIDSVKATQRGALQYQLGSLFGSRETQIAGLTNFATNLKDKYPGMFSEGGGKAAIGGVANQLTQLRAFDMVQSLRRDASMAQSIGQFGLAGEMQRKISTPEGLQSIMESARLQANAALGIKPEGLVSGLTSGSEAMDRASQTAKRRSDEAIKEEEARITPAATKITEELQKAITAIQQPVQKNIEALVGKGLEITNANILAKSVSLDIGKIFGSGKNEEAVIPARAGGPNVSEMARARSMAVTKEQNALSARGILGVPNFASTRPVATISRGFSPDLVSKSNPFGEAIINDIDEPLGMASLGYKSGKNFAGGFIPNFARKKKMPSMGNVLQYPSMYSIGVAANMRNSGRFLPADPRTEGYLFSLAGLQGKPPSSQEAQAGLSSPKRSQFTGQFLPSQKALEQLSLFAETAAPRARGEKGRFASGPAQMAITGPSASILATQEKLATIAKGRLDKISRLISYDQRAMPAELINFGRSEIFGLSPEEAARQQSAYQAYQKRLSERSKFASPIFEPTFEEARALQTAVQREQLKALMLSQLASQKSEAEKRAVIENWWKNALSNKEKREAKLAKIPLEYVKSSTGLQSLPSDFKKAGPGFMYSGSFGKPDLTRDFPASSKKGFDAIQSLLLREAGLAKQVIGPDYQNILSSRTQFEKWNSSGKILGVSSDGNSLVAKLNRSEQVAVNRALGGADPMTSRQYKRSFNRDPQNINRSNLIKSIILNSGLGPASIQAMTGLEPSQFKSTSPTDLDKLLKDRGIGIGLQNTKEFKVVGGGSVVTERDVLLDLSRSKLSEAEAQTIREEILKKAAGPYPKTVSRFNTASGNRFLSDLKLTQSSRPESTKPNFEFGKSTGPRSDGLFGPKDKSLAAAYREMRSKNALNLKGLFKGGSLGLLGYRGQASIDRAAIELINLEKQLSSYTYPDEVKSQIKQDFLNKQGSFADAVLERSNKFAARKDAKAFDKFVESSLSKVPKVAVGKAAPAEVLNAIMNGLKPLVQEGKLSPQDAARKYFKIAGDRGLSASTLGAISEAKTLKGLSTYQGVLEALSQGGQKEPSLRDSIAEAQLQRDKELATRKIRQAGMMVDTGLTKPIKDSKGRVIGTRPVMAKISFEEARSRAISEIMGQSGVSMKDKKAAIEKVRRALGARELLEKSSIAKKLGFEYNPLENNAMTQQERANLKEGLLAKKTGVKAGDVATLEKAAAQPSRLRKAGGLVMPGLTAGLSAIGAVQSGYGLFQALSSDEKALNKENLLLLTQFLGSSAATLGGLGQIGQLVSGSDKASKFASMFGGNRLGAAFGIAGAAGSGLEALKNFREGDIGSGLTRLAEAGTLGGAGLASAIGQKVVEQRLFGAAAFLGLAAEIANAENFQLAKVSDLDKTRGTMGKIGFGALQALTGQSIDQNFKAGQFLMDSLGLGFTAAMGPVGLAAVTAKVGYRVGNIIGDQIGLADKIAKTFYGVDGSAMGVSENEDGMRTAALRSRAEFDSDEQYRKYLQASLAAAKNNRFANGFIPNFALAPSIGSSAFGFSKAFGGVQDELNSINSSPDYAGYRNAVPMPTPRGVPQGIMNSAEIAVPAKEVYARMFGPFGYMMKPQNPMETTAILNPAQQRTLGMANGFVPNFSNEQFASMLSDAMKSGMTSLFANGFIPSASNSNSINIYDNRNIQNSMEGDMSVFKEVVGVLMKMYPKEMATIGPKVTQI